MCYGYAYAFPDLIIILINHLLLFRPDAENFYLHFQLSSYLQLSKPSIVPIPILEVRKLRLRKVKFTANSKFETRLYIELCPTQIPTPSGPSCVIS